MRLQQRLPSGSSRPCLLLTNHQTPTRGLCAAGPESGEAPGPPGCCSPHLSGADPALSTSLPVRRAQLPWERRGKPFRSGMSPASPSTRLGNQSNRLLSPRPRQAGGKRRHVRRRRPAAPRRGSLAPPSPASSRRRCPPPRAPHRLPPPHPASSARGPAAPRSPLTLAAPRRRPRRPERGHRDARTGSGGPRAGGGRRFPALRRRHRPPGSAAALPAPAQRQPHH